MTVSPDSEDDFGVEGGGPADDEADLFLPGDIVGIVLCYDCRHTIVQGSLGARNNELFFKKELSDLKWRCQI